MMKTKKVIFYSLVTLLQSTEIIHAAEQQEYNQQPTQSCTQPDFHQKDSKELIDFKELVKSAEKDLFSRETLLMKLHDGEIPKYFLKLIPIKQILNFSGNEKEFDLGNYTDIELEALITLLPPEDLTKDFVAYVETRVNDLPWLQITADQGCSRAQCMLGWIYYKEAKYDYLQFTREFNPGMSYDESIHDIALKYLKLAADQNDAWGHHLLAKLYDDINNPRRDKNLHLSHLQSSARLGIAEDQKLLGDIYMKGVYVAKNEERAFQWYHLAADNGCPDAQYNLARIYMERNNLSGYFKYMKLAAKQGVHDAKVELNFTRILYSSIKTAYNSNIPPEDSFVEIAYNSNIPPEDSSLGIAYNPKLPSEFRMCHNHAVRDNSRSIPLGASKLDLSYNKKFTYDFVSPKYNLTDLNLAYNTSIPDDSVSLLTNMTRLNLRGNNTITNRSISLLTNLTELNLRANEKITNESVSRLTNLTHLNLAHDRIITDDTVSRLTNLTKLNLFCNSTITNRFISLLTNLTHLNLTHNKIITDDSVSLLTNLTRLSLSDNKKITDGSVSLLTNLTRLNLNAELVHTSVTDDSVSRLTNLTYLRLRRNTKITDASVSILTNLTKLDLLYNSTITSEPISSLINLLRK